jgi:hypothetical protein
VKPIDKVPTLKPLRYKLAQSYPGPTVAPSEVNFMGSLVVERASGPRSVGLIQEQLNIKVSPSGSMQHPCNISIEPHDISNETENSETS